MDDYTEALHLWLSMEHHVVQWRHSLYPKLIVLGDILGHTEVDSTWERIYDWVIDFQELLDSKDYSSIGFDDEEREILRKLRVDVMHREWQVVTATADIESNEPRERRRLASSELKLFQDKFNDLVEICVDEKYKAIKDFATVYRSLFRHFIRKEIHIKGLSKGRKVVFY